MHSNFMPQVDSDDAAARNRLWVARFGSTFPAGLTEKDVARRRFPRIENLRDILRAKTVPLEGTKMSGPDINSMLSKGGDCLDVADCEILVAAARIAHDLHWQDAVTAIVSAKSVTMPMSQWFSSKMLSKALESSGKDYMALHSRFDGLPEWCVKSVERRYANAMALSPVF